MTFHLIIEFFYRKGIGGSREPLSITMTFKD